MDLRALIARLAGRRILLIGDLILDEYLIGQATRLSREAPVPVLELTRRFTVPGGAANPAHNIVALGGFVTQLGVVGDDENGRTLLAQLRDAGVDLSAVSADPERQTSLKTRIMAESALRFAQQVARLDRLDRRDVAGDLEARLCTQIEAAMPQADAVLLSNYNQGVLSERIVATVQAAARQHGKFVTVDSQGNLDRFRGCDLIRCNAGEAEGELRRTLRTDADFERALVTLLHELGARVVLISRGPAGVSLLARGEAVLHIAAFQRREVYDTTGAGDTQIGVLTLALAAGLDLRTAIHLANVAAGLVVSKLGNAVVSADELAEALT